MTPPRITLALLNEVGACARWRDELRARHPGGVDVTVELCVAEASIWPWDDAANMLLTTEGRGAYCPAYLGDGDRCTCDDLTYEEAAERFAWAALNHGLVKRRASSDATAST